MPSVPVFGAGHVDAALDPGEAVEVVRKAFVQHARGAWLMPSKVYLPAPPDGDFRAMPASGGGYAVLKWVTSFPTNPARALPTVTGVVLLSDAETGALRAVLEAGAVTALRTGAAAVLAAETLGRRTFAPAAVVGCGVNGRAVARTFLARNREVLLWDARPQQAERVAVELGDGSRVASDVAEALAADVVATVTPGRELVFETGTLHAGQHASLMGADGPGKAEIAVEELLRARIVCDEWEQASHNGDIARAVAHGRLRRETVAELGRVLLGEEAGRSDEREITVFDSTGLAVQDLAVAVAVFERYRAARDGDVFAGVAEVELE
ncbi:MAG: ornithine cyclodeaminase family protein [Thermoleophilia bacterium]|nr:ornithine cyclodeaminase family protein [Thermoleophilia bacterium]